MSMGGFLHDMNKRIEYNRSLLKKDNRFFKSRQLYKNTLKTESITIKSATKEQLDQVKIKIRAQQKRAFYLTLAKIFIASGIGIALIGFVFYWFTIDI